MPLNPELPLSGITVLDFSQFLAGPVAAMKLADLGARVIKVERRAGGDFARRVAIGEVYLDGDAASFHAFNRGKEGLAVDLKDPEDLELAKRLVSRADVLIQNFRPGVIERLGLDYASVRALNPRIVYASISGYGSDGPWVTRPGQDLLAQSLSGLPWYSGSNDSPPTAFGLALADTLAAQNTVQGILGLLLRRERTGEGGHVETSLIEGMIDLQFEVFTAKTADPTLALDRGPRNSAHALLAAPYGIYQTRDGYLALAMGDIPTLGRLIGLAALAQFADASQWLARREEICGLIAAHLATGTTQEWIDALDLGDYWCAPVLTPAEFMAHEGFTNLGMVGTLERTSGEGTTQVPYVKSPLRLDGHRPECTKAAPRVGEDNLALLEELGAGLEEKVDAT